MAKKSQRLRRQRRIELREAREQEIRLSQTIEDNHVVIERMKNMSSSIDKVLQTFDTTMEALAEAEPIPIMTVKPATKTTVEPKVEQVMEAPNFKKMLKKDLLFYAKEKGITIRSSMTKVQLIKTIQES